MLRFWNRLIKIDDSRIVKQVFLWDYSLNNENWCSEIEKILENIGLLHIFYDRSICCLNEVEQKLVTENQSKWVDQCISMPKLRTYIQIKHAYCTESYVKIYLSRYQRSLLAQIRSGILPLRIETGRYQNIKDNITKKMRKMKVEERICLICNSGAVENEIHFIFECVTYTDARNELFYKAWQSNENFCNITNIEKLEYLMNFDCKILAEYVVDSWKKRQRVLYVLYNISSFMDQNPFFWLSSNVYHIF